MDIYIKKFFKGICLLVVVIIFFYLIIDYFPRNEELVLSTSINIFFLTFKIYPLLVLSGIFIAFLFTGILNMISNTVRKLTIYHRLIDGCDYDKVTFGETFRQKFWKVFSSNLIVATLLTFVIIFALFPYINDNYAEPVGEQILSSSDLIFITIAILIPGFLLTLRILSNPTKQNNKKILKIIRISNPEIDEDTLQRSDNEKIKSIRDFKEKISSFYFSLIGSSILILFILIYYNFLLMFFQPSKISFLNTKVPIWVFVGFLIAELITIFIITVIGEYYLKEMKPIDEI